MDVGFSLTNGQLCFFLFSESVRQLGRPQWFEELGRSKREE